MPLDWQIIYNFENQKLSFTQISIRQYGRKNKEKETLVNFVAVVH